MSYYNGSRPIIDYRYPQRNFRHNQPYRTNVREVTRDIESPKPLSRTPVTKASVNTNKFTPNDQQHITKRHTVNNRSEVKKTKGAIKKEGRGKKEDEN